MIYLVYDIESTGLDVKNSEILEICIRYYDNEKILLHKYSYPNYENITNTNIHGIDMNIIKQNNGLTQNELIEKIINLFNQKKFKNTKLLLIAHNNNGFDQLILEYSFKRQNKKIPENVYFSDSLIMLKYYLPEYKYHNLSYLYNKLFENDEEENIIFHNSSSDTYALIKILKKTNIKLLLSQIKRPSFSNNKIKNLNYKLLYGLEYSNNNKSIKKIDDIFNIYLLSNKNEKNFTIILNSYLKINKKYKINKIIEQMELINELI